MIFLTIGAVVQRQATMMSANKYLNGVQPQRGCGTQPRVGAQRLPWVMSPYSPQPQRGCGKGRTQPLQGCKSFLPVTQGSSFVATLGCMTQPLWGWAGALIFPRASAAGL